MTRSVPRGGKKTRGFTITEALITVLVFSFFLAVLFMTISYGFRTFSVAVARADVTTEARRLMLFMEKELRSTAYFSVHRIKRYAGSKSLGLRRDGFCFVTVGDWSRRDSFNGMEQRPDWDRYICYYATKERPYGRLVRMPIFPALPEDIGSFPYPNFRENGRDYLVEDPLSLSLPDVSNVRILATKVRNFEVGVDATGQKVDVRIVLRQNGIMTRRADRNREGGTFELHYRVHPQNSK